MPLPWTDNTIRATVDVMESLGDAAVAMVIVGQQIFQFTLPPETEAETGRPVDLVVDLGNVHLFDPQTEELGADAHLASAQVMANNRPLMSWIARNGYTKESVQSV